MSNGRRINQRGYVALLTVLIVAAASLAITTAIIMNGVDASRTALAEQQAVQARSLASACAEEAMQVLKDPTATTSSGTLTLDPGTCRYDIVSTGADTRTLKASGRVGDIVKYATVYATIGQSSISVTSWQEVP